MQGLWAQRTWARKQTVWRQYTQFHNSLLGVQPTEVQEASATAFVVDTAMRVGRKAAKAYGNDLLAIRRKLQTLDLAGVVRAISAEHAPPEARAVTMSPVTFAEVLRSLPPPERTAAFLQWKTTSRWDDVCTLGRSNLIHLGPTELAVLFDSTKSTRRNPTRQDHQVVVRHLPELPTWLQIPNEGPLSQWSTERMDNFLRGLGEARGDERGPDTLSHYTVHAIKRGALSQLVKEAAAVRDFPVWLVPLMAKHKTRELIPDVTVGYLWDTQSRVALARVLRTAEATQLLGPR